MATLFQRMLASKGRPSTQLFAGVEKPTVTLARMLAAEMLQNLDAPTSGRPVARYENGFNEMKFPSFNLRVTLPYPDYKGETGPETIHSVTLKTGNRLTGDDEFKVLLDTYTKFMELRKRKQSLTAEEKRQQAALDAIEQLFKPKVVEAPVVEPKPMAAIDMSFLKVE